MWLLIGGRGRREEGGRKRVFIIIGQDAPNGIGEEWRLPKQLLRPLHCQSTEGGDLIYYCKNEQSQGCN